MYVCIISTPKNVHIFKPHLKYFMGRWDTNEHLLGDAPGLSGKVLWEGEARITHPSWYVLNAPM